MNAIIAKVKDTIISAAKVPLTETEKKVITDTIVYRVSGTNDFIIEAGVAENQAPMKDGKTDLTVLE